MELRTGAATLVGRVRQANEDAHLTADGLVAVADGMGGHLAGEVASADTVETLSAVVGLRSLEELVGAVHLANRRISDRAAEDPDLRGMGTTVCVLGTFLDGGEERLAVLNVGDSRVYHHGHDGLVQLTEDHSLVETLVREGRLTPAEAEVHPQRNVLTRALGVEPLVEVDVWVVTPCDGDRFLLCSDGLFNEVTDARIAEILAAADDPAVAASLLAERADTAGGRDNITAVVVDVAGTGRPSASLDARVRRTTVAPADLTHLHDPVTATEEATDDYPPVLAPLADDGPGTGGAGPAGPDADGPDADGPDADGPDTAEVDPVPPPGAVAAGTPSRRSWRFWAFAAAVAAVVLVGAVVIVVGALAGSPASTTTTTASTTSTTVATPTSEVPPSIVSTTLPPPNATAPAGPVPASPVPAVPGAVAPPAPTTAPAAGRP